MSHLKSSILWVIFLKKMFNSLSHAKKKVQFLEPFFSPKVQFFDSYSKKNWVILKKRFNSLSHIQKKSSTLWVISKKTHTQFFESNWRKKRFNSLSHIGTQERLNSLSHIEKDFNSVSHIEKRVKKKSSILWVIYKEFNSVSHLSKKKISIFCVSFLHKVQFFESY